MNSVFPKKLVQGDEIRVLSPSSSIDRVGGFEENLIAKRRLETLGFKVTFGDHILENDFLNSSSIDSRIADIHAAFTDKNVKAVLTTIGGFNCNELLPHINWDMIKENPKAFIGYSDTTSLHNAIRAKTGLITFYGPCYSAFKMNELQEFQTQEWLRAMTEKSYSLSASDVWTSDPWFDPSSPRHLKPNQWKVYNSGRACGIITGGNLQTYYLQAGTSFLPRVDSPIIFLERAEGSSPEEFSRELAHVLQLHPDITGLVVGRFPTENEMSEKILRLIFDKYPVLKIIPVIYDLDFGHTQPIFTFPLGGLAEISTEPIKIKILKG